MDYTENKSPEDLKLALFARVRLELETDEKVINPGEKSIIVLTDNNTYGFFDTDDEANPFVGIQLPQAASLSTPGKFVGSIEDIARNYLIESKVQELSPSEKLSLMSFDGELIVLENPRTMTGYTIEEGGQFSSFEIPISSIPDTFIEEIPERDE